MFSLSPPDRALAVAALLLLPVGFGVALTAPSSDAALVASAPVLKTYYFHRDAVLPDTDRHGWLNTSGPTNPVPAPPRPFDYDYDNDEGITLDNAVSGTPQTRGYNFSSSPIYARDFHIFGNLTAQLHFGADKNQGSPTISIAVTLFDLPESGGPPVQISSASVTTFISKTTGAGPAYGFSPVAFTFSNVNYTLAQRHQLGIRVERTDASSYQLYLAFDATAVPSALVFATDTTLAVVDAATMDAASRRKTLFLSSEVVVILLRVGHAMGSAEVAGASMELINNADGSLNETATSMVFSAVDVIYPSYWKEFVLVHSPLFVGNYTVRVNATDFSGAVVTVDLPLDVLSAVSVDHFEVAAAPLLVQIGVVFNVTVQAKDASNANLTAWAGDVRLEAVDSLTLVPVPGGSLSNTTVNVGVGQGGRGWVVGGTNYTGPATPLRIRAEAISGPSANGTSAPLTILPGPLATVSIEPGTNQTLTAGSRLTLTARGWDAFGNPNASFVPAWGLQGGIGDLSTIGSFTVEFGATSAGTGQVLLVVAGRPTLQDAVGITVLAGPVVTISFSPVAPLILTAGAPETLTTIGRDAYNNINTTWRPNWVLSGAPLGGGIILKAGLYYEVDLAFTEAGFTALLVTDPDTGRSAGRNIEVLPGGLNSITVEVEGAFNRTTGEAWITTAEVRRVSATGLDRYGNVNTSWTPVWSILAGQGGFENTSSPYDKVFVPEQSGKIVVKVAGGGFQATVTFHVEPIGLSAAMRSPIFWSTSSLLALSAVGTAISVWRLRPTIIDEVLLISSSGLLLKRRARYPQLKAEQDDDILAGMLTTVQEFVADSFEAGGGAVDEIKFRKSRIILRRFEHIILAAIVSRGDTGKVRAQVEAAAQDIEERFGPTLEGWDGALEQLDPLDDVVDRLISGRYSTT